MVSDSEGEKTFSLDRFTGQTGTLENPDQAYVKRHYHTSPAVVTVKTVTIDSIRKHSNPVDFIKIDVDGHESKILAGGEQTFIRDFPILIFEHFNHDQTLLAYLLGMGYRLYDAERMEAPQVQTTNYLALPPCCFEKADVFFQRWHDANESL